MKKLFLVVTVIAANGGVAINDASACARHLPNFELAGFPISQHQVAVLGAAQVKESAATPMLMLAGMPASPHQIAVLKPRAKKSMIAAASSDSGFLTVGLASPGSQRSEGCPSE